MNRESAGRSYRASRIATCVGAAPRQFRARRRRTLLVPLRRLLFTVFGFTTALGAAGACGSSVILPGNTSSAGGSGGGRSWYCGYYTIDKLGDCFCETSPDPSMATDVSPIWGPPPCPAHDATGMPWKCCVWYPSDQHAPCNCIAASGDTKPCAQPLPPKAKLVSACPPPGM